MNPYETLLLSAGMAAEQAPPLRDALYDAEQLPEDEPTEMDRAGIDPLTPVDTFIAMNSTTRYIGEIA